MDRCRNRDERERPRKQTSSNSQDKKIFKKQETQYCELEENGRKPALHKKTRPKLQQRTCWAVLTYSPLPEADRKARMTCASCCDRTAAQLQLQAQTKLSSLRNQHHARKITAESIKIFFSKKSEREQREILWDSS